MKIIFLSVRILMFGCFCDILRGLCQKAAENSLKKGKSLIGKPIVELSAFTEKSLTKWQRREQQLICLLEQIS